MVVHQAPQTAKGFRFLTLEDEFGFINVVVRPKLYKRYYRLLNRTKLLRVTGILERQEAVLNVLAIEFRELTR